MERPGVLITGASRGIGLACAEALVRRGWTVVGTSRDPRAYDETLRGRLHPATPFHLISMDVDEDASVEDGLSRALSILKEIHAVVANAGGSVVGPLEELPMDAVRQQVETNLLGVIRVVRGVLPHLRMRGGGTVVVMGSLASRIPLPFQSVYTATKAALVGFCAALRMETRPFGIRVHLVEPTDIRTPLTDHRRRYLVPESPYEERFLRCMGIAERAERTAEGPEVVAEAVARILERGRGPTRIPAGRGARLMGWIRGLLPDPWAEALIRRHFQV